VLASSGAAGAAPLMENVGGVFVPSGRLSAAARAARAAQAQAQARAAEELASAAALPDLPAELLVFRGFASLMARAPLRWLCARATSKLDAWFALFESCLVRTSPRLAFHLRDLGVAPNLYLVGWLLSLFSKPLGLEGSARLWDVCLIGGHAELLRCCVGLVRYLEPALLGRPFERVVRTLARVPPELQDPFALAAAVDAVRFVKGEMTRLAALDEM